MAIEVRLVDALPPVRDSRRRSEPARQAGRHACRSPSPMLRPQGSLQGSRRGSSFILVGPSRSFVSLAGARACGCRPNHRRTHVPNERLITDPRTSSAGSTDGALGRPTWAVCISRLKPRLWLSPANVLNGMCTMRPRAAAPKRRHPLGHAVTHSCSSPYGAPVCPSCGVSPRAVHGLSAVWSRHSAGSDVASAALEVPAVGACRDLQLVFDHMTFMPRLGRVAPCCRRTGVLCNLLCPVATTGLQYLMHQARVARDGGNRDV